MIQAGDLVAVVPGEKIPVDGVVVEGTSLVDEALITGESMPVSKTVDDPVIGGTINHNGALIIETTHVEGETVLSQIVTLIEDVQTSKVSLLSSSVSQIFSAIFVSKYMFLLCFSSRPCVLNKLG